MTRKQAVKVWNKFIVPAINVLFCVGVCAGMIALFIAMGLMWLSGQY